MPRRSSTIADRLWAGVQGPTVQAIAQVLDARADAIQDVVDRIAAAPRLDAPLGTLAEWELERATRLFRGKRDPAWTLLEWHYCLRLHAAALYSTGTLPDLITFAKAASPVGLGTVDVGPVSVTFIIGGGLDLSPAMVDCLVRHALEAIPDVAELQIVGSTTEDAAKLFTFDVDGLGFDFGLLAGSIYP